MFQFITNLRNMIDYPLRQLFRWRRNGLNLTYQSKKKMFSEFSEDEQIRLNYLAENYLHKYDLDWIYRNSNQRIYRQNLYYLQLLETVFKNAGVNSLPETIHAADIGVSDWFYVQVLHSFCKKWNAEKDRKVLLEGYEIDAFRVYSDLYSRMDYALAFCSNLENVHYYPEAFKGREDFYDLVFMFFPFIHTREHLQWGLPIKYYDPHLLLSDTWKGLREGGYLLVVNQGQAEAEVQAGLFRELGITPFYNQKFNSKFYSYDFDRYAFLIKK